MRSWSTASRPPSSWPRQQRPPRSRRPRSSPPSAWTRCSVTGKECKKEKVRNCLGFWTADFRSWLVYKSAVQKPKHCLTCFFALLGHREKVINNNAANNGIIPRAVVLPQKQDADDLNNDLKSDLKNEERTSRGESEFSEWWEVYVFTLKLSTYTEWCIWSRTSFCWHWNNSCTSV